jgi:F-type H+-transporting ATPase subunit delta
MTDFTTAARPYAKAVYDIASQAGMLDSWGDALANLAAVVSDAQVSEMLNNPEMGKQQKGDMLIKVLADNLSEQQQNFVKLMAENGRLIIMLDVLD